MSDDKSNYNRLSELLGHFSIANGSFGGNDGGRSRRGFVRLTAVECNENLIVLSKSRELFSLLCCHHCCLFIAISVFFLQESQILQSAVGVITLSHMIKQIVQFKQQVGFQLDPVLIQSS